MKNQDQFVSAKWKKEYTAVLIFNIVYIFIFYVLMQIFS